MTLSDKILSRSDKDELLRLLDGNICRICVTDSLEELLNQFGFAIDRLQALVVNRRNELLSSKSD